MSTPIDYITAPTGLADMTYASRLIRQRARIKPSPYNPDRGVEDWENPDTLEFDGFIANSSSTVTPDTTRQETTSIAVLTVPDPTVDIREGDRIIQNDDTARKWEVTGVPARDRHPWTGWQPTLEAQLTEWKG